MDAPIPPKKVGRPRKNPIPEPTPPEKRRVLHPPLLDLSVYTPEYLSACVYHHERKLELIRKTNLRNGHVPKPKPVAERV